MGWMVAKAAKILWVSSLNVTLMEEEEEGDEAESRGERERRGGVSRVVRKKKGG